MKNNFILRIAVLPVAGIVGAGAFVLSTWATSPVSWVMIVSGIALFGVCRILERADTRQYDQDTKDWFAELRTLVDAGDLDCDPHIGDFTPEERKQILEELTKMTPGHRNLRVAIHRVWPDTSIE